MTNDAIHDMPTALGAWTTDLFIPRYREGEFGPWKIIGGGGLLHDSGYHTGCWLVEKMPALLRRVETVAPPANAWEVWMSLTPHEIESQEAGCRHAFGHTVIMGLGMGWIAANAALNPRVRHVTVVEVDSDVIDLFNWSGALDSLPEAVRGKIKIENADAMEWRPDVPVDFLYADIWRTLDEPGCLDQVRTMQANVGARTICYWGQELAIYRAAGGCAAGDTPLDAQIVSDAVNRVIGLPLLLPPDRDYPQTIGQVIRNRIRRRLGIRP